MDIGKKLKSARNNNHLTQEKVAELMQVSRQTISNWENGKSYPDVISIITLSDLYQVSLDVLLKGDLEMMQHIEESTDIVKSNKKLILAIILEMIIFSVLLLLASFFGTNRLLITAAFTLATLATAFLLHQIVKRI
ncbi:helix-turn-helix domain-containing protein [Streptococcus uberis]|uniref:helix-turn-helix domain-containing protein n=1 Tax=Streptococcus uberis TaxID=1349 RepID=UPI000DF974A7|nr:helix-turn-helix transcriptional regulator [Streptococcus uberis]SUO89036.1 putative transcriptional regulator [Streptococcus uberis]